MSVTPLERGEPPAPPAQRVLNSQTPEETAGAVTLWEFFGLGRHSLWRMQKRIGLPSYIVID